MGCNNFWSFIAVTIGIVFGAVIGILFAFIPIPFMGTAIWIAFGLGVLALVALIIEIFIAGVTAPNVSSKCLHKGTGLLLVGAIGTIISSIVALSITLTPTLIAVITIIAIVAFFFALMVVALISVLLCIASRLHGTTV